MESLKLIKIYSSIQVLVLTLPFDIQKILFLTYIPLDKDRFEVKYKLKLN